MLRMDELRVLLACQEPGKQTQIHQQLNAGGIHRVVKASTARQVLALLKSEAIDILISSIDLADIDAWRLTRLIRCGALTCSPELPVVILTEVWCQRIAEVTAREYGVSCLVPEGELPTLLETLRRCVLGGVKPKPQLLVIQPHPDSAGFIRRVLDRQYAVDIAGTGDEGLVLWRQRQHRLVLLADELPDMTGPALLAAIIKEKPAQQVVVMTRQATSEFAEQMMMDGAADLLPEPFRSEDLCKACELAIRRDDYLTSNREYAEQVASLRSSEMAFRRISETHQQLLDNLQTVVMELDARFCIRFLNYPWKTLMGFSVEATIGSQLMDYVLEEDVEHAIGLEAKLESVLNGTKETLAIEVCLLDSKGQMLWAHMKVRRSELNHAPALTLCLDNITKRKEAQRQLEYLSMHDAVTGLFNRRYFEESLRQSYADALRNHRRHGLVYIDLDYFQVINDTFGHNEGDDVLRQIGQLMSRRIRAEDVLCRLGGDEFGVLVHDIGQTMLLDLAGELQQIVNDYVYQAKGHRVNLGCSVGLSYIDGKAICAEEYLMQADIALYVAKGRGRNLIHMYDPNDNESEELRSRINWTQRLRLAIAENRIVLHFQPVFDAYSNEVVYYEALVRMQDEQGKLIYPNQFIPALENTGEMHLLDRWIVKLAIKAVHDFPKIHKVSINLSAQAFKDDNLLPVVKEALRANGVAPSAVTFELTESASLFNMNVTKHLINELNAIGCTFAIDDFGSGFSSFAYLKELPAHYIKLDGSFIKNLHQDDVDKALVQSLIQVVQALGKKAVAEFVENEKILEILRGFGVDCVQGFYTGKPMPVEKLDLFTQLA